MADDFTRDKFRWLDQVAADHDLKGALAFRVAYAVSKYRNRTTGDAWPGQKTLASECGVTIEAVRNAVARLVRNGHLEVTVANGRGSSNRYLPVLKTPTPVEVSRKETRTGVGVSAPEETPTAIVENPNGGSEETPTPVGRNPNGGGADTFDETSEKETIEETIEGDISPTADDFFEKAPKKRKTDNGSNIITQTAVNQWNAMADEQGIRHVQHLTDKRMRKLPLRLGEIGGIEGWRTMLSKIAASPFLLGRNKDGWKVTFDWVLEPGNLTKIMEGNYDGQTPNQQGSYADCFWRNE